MRQKRSGVYNLAKGRHSHEEKWDLTIVKSRETSANGGKEAKQASLTMRDIVKAVEKDDVK
ncbi:hypothetical protein [Paenibacillus glycanilyticus]|uniref:hypothetical protein n=1 Tax=Paenibacillus glycanilyticus TaxID=126569 RepID=UPI0019109FB1|nr:hypothetical protein [Paenibacillus glycanilyticus]